MRLRLQSKEHDLLISPHLPPQKTLKNTCQDKLSSTKLLHPYSGLCLLDKSNLLTRPHLVDQNTRKGKLGKEITTWRFLPHNVKVNTVNSWLLLGNSQIWAIVRLRDYWHPVNVGEYWEHKCYSQLFVAKPSEFTLSANVCNSNAFHDISGPFISASPARRSGKNRSRESFTPAEHLVFCGKWNHF